MKNSGKIALCGVLSALSVVCMLLTVIPIGTFALPAIAGIILMPIALEVSTTWGIGAYIATSLLTFLMAPDMEAKLLFITFFGYYPVLKNVLEKVSKVWVRWIIKISIFNGTMIGSYLLLLYVLGLPKDSFELFGVSLPWLFLLVGNFVFVLFDYALDGLVKMNYNRWHKLFIRLFK